METLFSISIALGAGLIMSRLAKPLGLPSVTAYLIAGILIGPYCLGSFGIEGMGFISHENVKEFEIISNVALGFIAFAIGNEFRLSQLKKVGGTATFIGIFQALIATLMVDAVLIGLHFILGEEKLPLSMAITLGAVAAATAPAATLMVVRQYKAKGKLTDLLLPIVAIDDAVGLIIFAISFGIAKAVEHGEFSMKAIILEPVIEIVCSLALGAIMGVLFSIFERFFSSNSKRLCLSVTCVIFTVALSMVKFEIGGVHVGFSALLVCMMLGTIFCNICDFSAEIMEKTDKWTVPLFALFFVLSGAELELSVFTDLAIVGIGIAYIFSRSLGKYFGAFGSAKLMKCDKKTTKYLGITLLPQAGVALGMSVTAMELGEVGEMIRNIVLFSVLIYELFGPVMTKWALTRAGNIEPKPHHKNRKHRTAPAKI
ncbi:MAG: cation:proton antiporter [Acutalibacteraceae bacterium]|nr:cation:proton antiporter [Acutalibacteraceae bacterium]